MYYYLSRALASYHPFQILCIMHNNMIHSKTTSSCFVFQSKATNGLLKLPISMTQMLAHGHGDIIYAHYALGLYLVDSNHTIGSIAKFL